MVQPARSTHDGCTMRTAIELAFVIATFIVVLATVLGFAFRERHLSERLRPRDVAAGRASDKRVMVLIFGSIGAGMILMLVTAAIILGSVQ
jgi:lysylphosphatidylglycerol synthetase-like protein (DUF2156 family)